MVKKTKELKSRVRFTVASQDMPYKQIVDEHREVQDLFAEVTRGETSKFSQLRQKLLAHMEFEETNLYPLLKATDVKDLALEADEEHRAARTLLSEIDRMSTGSDLWHAKVQTLREMIEHHIKEEEKRLLPLAHEVLEPGEEDQLAYELQRARGRINV